MRKHISPIIVTKEIPPGGRTVIRECAEIWLEDGVMRVVYLDGAEISPEIKHEMHLAFLRITEGKKHPFMFESAGSLWYTREGREYARQLEPKQPFLAVAMIAPNLGFRLLADFYARLYKPLVPYKVFKTKAEALTWLRMFVEN